MFPLKIMKNSNEYYQTSMPKSKEDLKDYLIRNPNEVYVVANEKLEEDTESLFTEFLVIYTRDFNDSVTLYDVSREIHSKLTINLDFLVKGYIEHIEVGRVDRFPIALYALEEVK